MQQARPRAALEKAVRARAQQKRALQRRDRAIHGPNRRKRSEITGCSRPSTAMFEDLRRPVVAGDHDVGKRFIVAQQHVKARPQPLDEVCFKQQRLSFSRRGDKLHRRRQRHHPLDAGVVPGRPRVRCEALLDAFGFADIEHLARGIEHAIDAGRGRREPGVAQAARRGRPRAVRPARRRQAPALRCRAAPAPRRLRRVRSLDRCLCLGRPCRICPVRYVRFAAHSRTSSAALRRMVNNSDRRRRKYTVPYR